jgi:dUTP pyrophosphatase
MHYVLQLLMPDGILRVKLLRTGARLPGRATAGASGLDLYACIDGVIELGPDPIRVPTGIAIEAPAGFDLQIRPRSSLSVQGVNAILGTIDSDYRGEIFVAMHTFGSRRTYRVHHGDRIAQLVISRVEALEVTKVDELSESARGVGGYGSTGR